MIIITIQAKQRLRRDTVKGSARTPSGVDTTLVRKNTYDTTL